MDFNGQSLLWFVELKQYLMQFLPYAPFFSVLKEDGFCLW